MDDQFYRKIWNEKIEFVGTLPNDKVIISKK